MSASATCCCPILSASAAAPRLCQLQLLFPDCVNFSRCSPTASTSAAAPRLHLLQLFYCSPIVSVSGAAPQLHTPTPSISAPSRVLKGSNPCPAFSSILSNMQVANHTNESTQERSHSSVSSAKSTLDKVAL